MSRRAFTFIEILLVTSLIAILSLSIFTCFSNGLKLWDRSRREILTEDISIFFDRFASDLRNTFIFSTIPLDGGENSFVFPTVVLTKADEYGSRRNEEFVDQLGRVRYAFDFEKGAIMRQQANYSQSTRNDWADAKTMAVGIKELKFKYYYSGIKEYQLHADNSVVLPSAVEVAVRFMQGGEEKTMSRFVSIPLGI
ncbi:MAG: prepilin-type N-terminal cleavage/methylation domain-containing protein [Candidatus Omnitrophica bacterium]|nr:prepilin-type N-terminal cleavage/methylation domain-containing protein [Candidatus Omnitrophota bacterium]